MSANGVKKLTSQSLDETLSNEELSLAIMSSGAVVQCLDDQIKRLEKVVVHRVRLRKEFKGLLKVCGIGKVLALTIMLEVGDIGRFATVGDFSSYARCVGGRRMSNGKKKGTVNTKNGNKYLCWAFIEAANFAIRYNQTVRRYYQRKLAEAHPMVAKKTIAHKLARACYYVLRDGVDFDANRPFGG